VQTLLGDKATDFDALQPYKGPDQLAAWYAVLSADASDIKDVQFHLAQAYAMPLAVLIGTVTVE
jgi:hypothetical protein